jgi:hypothetical protein
MSTNVNDDDGPPPLEDMSQFIQQQRTKRSLLQAQTQQSQRSPATNIPAPAPITTNVATTSSTTVSATAAISITTI